MVNYGIIPNVVTPFLYSIFSLGDIEDSWLLNIEYRDKVSKSAGGV